MLCGSDFRIFKGRVQLRGGAQGCAQRADRAGGDRDTHTHTQMLQAGFPHICSPAVGPQLSIAQLFQLKNVNSRERDTSGRESTAQQLHSSTGRSFAWHWRHLDAGEMDLEESIQPQGCSEPCQARCPQRGSLSWASINHPVISPVPHPSCPSSPLPLSSHNPQPFHCTRSSLLQQELQKSPVETACLSQPQTLLYTQHKI